MIKVIISTLYEDAAPIIVDENVKTPAQVIAESRFNSLGGTWRANSTTLDGTTMNKPFAQLGYGPANNTASLSNIPNQKNA